MLQSDSLQAYSTTRVCGDWARRVLFSSAYVLFSIGVVIIMVALFIWELIIIINKNTPHHPVFVILEVSVNVGLLLDISLRISAQQRDYLKHWGNIFDCFVAALSILVMILFFTLSSDNRAVEIGEVEIDIVLLAFRNIITCLRTIVVIKNSKSSFSPHKVGYDFVDVTDVNNTTTTEPKTEICLNPNSNSLESHHTTTSSSSYTL